MFACPWVSLLAWMNVRHYFQVKGAIYSKCGPFSIYHLPKAMDVLMQVIHFLNFSPHFLYLLSNYEKMS